MLLLENIKGEFMNFMQRKSLKLVDFIKRGIENNGGNYEQIKARMVEAQLFLMKLDNNALNRKFANLSTAYNDFFTTSDKIKDVEFSSENCSAMYVKDNLKRTKAILGKNMVSRNRYGVAVLTDKRTQFPMLYFGARKNAAEISALDTGVLFKDNKLVFHHEGKANYDEIRLWGSGAHGEFFFDEHDKLIRVELTTMSEPRMSIWGDTQVFDLSNNIKNLKESNIQGLNSPEMTE